MYVYIPMMYECNECNECLGSWNKDFCQLPLASAQSHLDVHS